jgi:carboxyl-terminal processing protease
VALTIYRADEADPITLTIPREEIHVPNVDYRVIETGSGSVGYIELNTFGSDAVSEMREAVKSFDPDQISGVILDLRFNGGGLLDAAVDIVSMFLSKGTVVEVQRRDTPLETHFVTGQPILPSL